MSSQLTAKTQYVTTGDVHYAYREIGSALGTPLVLLHHFRGTIDLWDPDLVDGLAKYRRVILFDNAGVGHSSGSVSRTVVDMADNVVKFLFAVGVSNVDLLGFSLGGYVAQMIALNYPLVVRKLILAGTAPSAGPQIVPLPSWVAALAAGPVTPEVFQKLFFFPSETSQAAALEFWERVHLRQGTSDEPFAYYVADDAMMSQVQCLIRWGTENPENFDPREASFGRLEEIKAPTLVVQGHTDVMVPTIGSFILSQGIPNSQLIIYPDSGHGSIFQYSSVFVQHANLFLDA